MSAHRLVLFRALQVLVILAIAFPVTGSASAEEPTPKVGLVVTESGIADNGLNLLAYQGLQRAEADMGVMGSLYTPADQNGYSSMLQQCVDDGNGLCIAVGFPFGVSLANVARDNPDTQWAIVDYSYPDCWEGASEGVDCGSFSEIPNVRGMRFNEKQAGYLAGVLAGEMTATNVVGAVGGMEIPPVVAFVEGYRNGAQCSNFQVSVLSTYTGTFFDPDLGASTAQDMIGQGADVIFGAAGPTGNGAILYSAQNDKWAVGVDSDQYLTVFGGGSVDGSDKLLSSAMKRYDNAVYQTIQDYVNGAFTSGTILYDLAMDGVGLAPFHETDGSIPQSVKDNLEKVRQGIINGTVDIDDPCTPPTGFHDYDSGDVPSWACNAGGWAMDPDSPDEDAYVRILADGIQVMEPFLAQNYREDLETSWNEGGGGCPGGTCAFEVSLWGLIDSYVPHEITVEAQDLQSGEWHPLNSTPKTLTCRTYDIYAYNPTAGATQWITKQLTDTDEYDPTWSPDGKKVAHDVVTGDTHGIYVTNVGTGVSTPLKGAQNGGNDAAWSPSGSQIVFDRRWFDDPSLYSLPPAGGKPKLLRHDAVNAAWSPNGKFLAFHQPSDGSLRTVFFAAPGGTARFIGYGEEPAWSPDGKWIAYVKDGDIWKVAVDRLGAALSAPIQLTSGPFSDGGPTWSRDSQTIIYSSGMTRDADLWSVPAAGGDPTWLTGAPEFGEYGPAVGKNSPKIAYASFSPEGQAARTWVTAYTYDAGTWDEGSHTYHIDWNGSDGSSPGPDVSFDVSGSTSSYPGYVLLRGAAVRGYVDGECPVLDPPVIRPDQPTLFHNGYLSYEVTYAEAVAFFDGATVTAYWDDAGPAQLVHHAVFPWSSVDWLPYICTFTAP